MHILRVNAPFDDELGIHGTVDTTPCSFRTPLTRPVKLEQFIKVRVHGCVHGCVADLLCVCAGEGDHRRSA